MLKYQLFRKESRQVSKEWYFKYPLAYRIFFQKLYNFFSYLNKTPIFIAWQKRHKKPWWHSKKNFSLHLLEKFFSGAQFVVNFTLSNETWWSYLENQKISKQAIGLNIFFKVAIFLLVSVFSLLFSVYADINEKSCFIQKTSMGNFKKNIKNMFLNILNINPTFWNSKNFHQITFSWF